MENLQSLCWLIWIVQLNLAYLDENIKSFEAKIQALKDGPQKKRTKGQIADAEDQLRSYYKTFRAI